MKLYKWLNGTKSCHGGSGEWGLPKNGKPGKWFHVNGKLVLCHNGIHLCREQDLIDWIATDLYETEHKGRLIEDDNKVVVRSARIVKVLDGWNEQTARLFACDCAERVLEIANDPRSARAIWVARAYALGVVGMNELRAARDAVWYAARTAEDAARTAKDAARTAVRDAARDATWYAAWYAARYAEREWQTTRLLEYANREIDLDEIRLRTEKWLKENP